MSPIQQMLLGVGAVATKTYVDDLFSTVLYTGTGSSQTISTGINQSGEGALTWIKERSGTQDNILVDSVRGPTKRLVSNGTGAESTDNSVVSAFTSSGFTVGNSAKTNDNGETFASWTFRKAKGFCDVVTYTGNSSDTQTISHSLGCVPGLIIVKRTNDTGDFAVLHRNLGAGKYLRLNQTSAESDTDQIWNDTEPTSTQFTAGVWVNAENSEYVAYLFAGGESTAATARSVDFDGSDDHLSVPNSNDYSFGSGDFTVEGWFNLDTTSSASSIIGVWDYSNTQRSWLINADNNGQLGLLVSPNGSGGGSTTSVVGGSLSVGQWTHFAGVRNGNTLTLYVNGEQVATSSFSGSLYDNSDDSLFIGSLNGTANRTDGKISNIRVVKGTAVYTSPFRPPTAPLTSITNTVLLCCNNSSVTGKTTGGTITATGSPTASTDSPFDDPAGFAFGENEDQNVIKCGSYTGNASTDGPEINLGWEPQWVIIKNASGSESWRLMDSMRGIVTGANDAVFFPNDSSQEYPTYDAEIDLTPTGFKVTNNDAGVNGSGNTIIYIAIRRPDGYVGKPPELGTGVFAMDTGDDSSTIPNYDSGFPVDFAFKRYTATSNNWQTSARLIQGKYLDLNDSDAEGTSSGEQYDSNVGYNKDQSPSTVQAWMLKRHAGFDVVTYGGNSTGNSSGDSQNIPHSLNAIPEMMWVKCRNDSGEARSWFVYHKGFNGGTTPEQWNLKLNTSTDQAQDSNRWNNTAPTSTHFTVGAYEGTNAGDDDFLALLFSSVDGISKVGYYDGSSSSQTITTGFQPRFVMIKCTTNAEDWYLLDTTRGWASGNDNILRPNLDAAQYSNDLGAPTSTGFTLTVDNGSNASGRKYIYYAHA